jgi:uncharacterized protein YecE (DUF72 family)
VNCSFYRLPSESTLRAWVEAVPARFILAVEDSRYITHVLRLRGRRKRRKHATPGLHSWAGWDRVSRESADSGFCAHLSNSAQGNAVADAQALLGLAAGCSGSTEA